MSDDITGSHMQDAERAAARCTECGNIYSVRVRDDRHGRDSSHCYRLLDFSDDVRAEDVIRRRDDLLQDRL